METDAGRADPRRVADRLDAQHRSATPKSLFGQAVGYARNQRASLVRSLDDARFAIDNGVAERAIRPLAIGRSNRLHVGGDGGLKTASVLLGVCASATRHRRNPWSHLRDVLDQLAVRPAGTDLLPDAPPRLGADSLVERVHSVGESARFDSAGRAVGHSRLGGMAAAVSH